MKRYLSFCMLGIATMLASCSQNEELLQGVNNNSSNAVTFSVALDEGMKTRAYTEDPAVSTMKLQAILLEESATEQDEPTPKEITAITPNEDGTFAVTVSGMMTNSRYKLVLWADNGSDYTVTNYVATPANQSKPGIAFYGTSGEYQTPDELSASASKTLELTHAVAKVTLNTTTALTDGKIATLSVPTCTSFNLISGEATGDGNATDTSEGVTSGNLCSVYVLCNDDDELPTATITLSNGQEKKISSLPMKRNNHIKLQGDVDGIRTAGTLDFKVYLAGDWNEETSEFLDKYSVNSETHTIFLSEAGILKTALIEQAVADETDITLTLSGSMNETDAQALHDYFYGEFSAKDTHVSTLDMSGVTGLTTIKDDTFYNATYLKKVTLPASVTSIGAWAFVGSGLETFTADNVTNVGEGAFSWCEKLIELSLPSVTTFGSNDFILENCTSLTTLKLTSPDFDGVFSGNFFYNVTTENVDLYLHKNLESYVNKGSDSSTGNLIYLFYNPSNQYFPIAEFKSITLVDDSGNPVDESTL